MANVSLDDAVRALRRFNRFHTRFVGALRSDFLGTHYSLQEARVLWELAADAPLTHRDLRERLDLDQGYTSRILARLRDAGLIAQEIHPDDRRARLVTLTEAGRQAFLDLDRRSEHEAAERIDHLAPNERVQLVHALEQIQALLDGHEAPHVEIRKHSAGDIGWTLMRQAEVYAADFGYSPIFEAYVSDGIPPFLHGFDPDKDALWIAEQAGHRIGSIAIQHDSKQEGWAKLRWYLVESHVRRQGIGTRLIDTAMQHCRDAGYQGVYLWTMSDLPAARRQYERVGFRLAEEAFAEWKPDEKQQKWEVRF